MLYEAVENLAEAVRSCDARVAIEEAKVGDLTSEEAAKKRRDVKEVKEIVNDMLVRVSSTPSNPKNHKLTNLSSLPSSRVPLNLLPNNHSTPYSPPKSCKF